MQEPNFQELEEFANSCPCVDNHCLAKQAKILLDQLGTLATRKDLESDNRDLKADNDDLRDQIYDLKQELKDAKR